MLDLKKKASAFQVETLDSTIDFPNVKSALLSFLKYMFIQKMTTEYLFSKGSTLESIYFKKSVFRE